MPQDRLADVVAIELAALAGVFVIIAFVVILATRRSSGQSPERVAELEEENRRLRGQVNERREPGK
jgi:hypothetical protein